MQIDLTIAYFNCDRVRAVLQHLKALRRSITMLMTRVDVISSYLEASQKGEIPWDARLMRAAAEVLPAERIPRLVLNSPRC
mmetsp:Transcript_26790/g.104037  ORF Transcript_26790/g.104037 Transcript_26790/m.104037 type:complete len:81 (+) Transcript_26790:784-1026(+)